MRQRNKRKELVDRVINSPIPYDIKSLLKMLDHFQAIADLAEREDIPFCLHFSVPEVVSSMELQGISPGQLAIYLRAQASFCESDELRLMMEREAEAVLGEDDSNIVFDGMASLDQSGFLIPGEFDS